MNRKVLFVDDEPNILEGFQRQLRKAYEVDVATDGAAGLKAIKERGPFAVIVSDMRMPEMSGTEFLSMAQVMTKNSVRIMLTGNADQQTAIEAVNRGQIFRFLTKPCPTEILVRALHAGVEQYRLICAEVELLEKTLLGSIGVLAEIVGVADPVAFEHAKRLRLCAQQVAPSLDYPDKWQLELAALLSPIGRMTLPAEMLTKVQGRAELSDAEAEALARVPEIGHNLLVKIPRLAPVAEIVRYHTARFQPSPSVSKKTIAGDDIPMGARILKILSDLIEIEAKGTSRSLAFRLMSTRHGWYDPDLLRAISAHYDPPLPAMAPKARGATVARRLAIAPRIIAFTASNEEPVESMELLLDELDEGDVLTSDVQTNDGVLLLAKGNILTLELLETLKSYASMSGVREPIQVAVIDDDA